MHKFREMEGIALRYWNDSCGGVVEHIIDYKMAEDRSAKGLLSLALLTLVDEHDISLKDGIVSNTFDGASVMSGQKGKFVLLKLNLQSNVFYIWLHFYLSHDMDVNSQPYQVIKQKTCDFCGSPVLLIY